MIAIRSRIATKLIDNIDKIKTCKRTLTRVYTARILFNTISKILIVSLLNKISKINTKISEIQLEIGMIVLVLNEISKIKTKIFRIHIEI